MDFLVQIKTDAVVCFTDFLSGVLFRRRDKVMVRDGVESAFRDMDGASIRGR